MWEGNERSVYEDIGAIGVEYWRSKRRVQETVWGQRFNNEAKLLPSMRSSRIDLGNWASLWSHLLNNTSSRSCQWSSSPPPRSMALNSSNPRLVCYQHWRHFHGIFLSIYIITYLQYTFQFSITIRALLLLFLR